MRKVLLTILPVLILLVFGGIIQMAFGAADEYLIVPGKSVGSIEIGKPIPKAVMDAFGKPTNYTKPSPGKDGRDTGNYYWEGRLNVKINDGRGDFNVFQILINSPKYHTKNGIRLGSTTAEVKKAYPSGKKIEWMDCDFAWTVTGVAFCINGGKVVMISVVPAGTF